ncbi:MAG TPA: prepilin-type N-terminal cleavage/methylation domain-containing protein [Vicinamibacterales bacterium]|jgi:prepilin peptidase dependent protein D|nr:prepilin-type N-terminal cleavage/methylation domain-containing protein [Vicinamibacterales bacterium]
MTPHSERGFTLIELLIVVAVISIVSAIAVPGLLRSRMMGNEASAIASLRTTTSSQVSFSASWGNGGYAPDYETLGTVPAGSDASGFISSDLGHAGDVVKSGYLFVLQGTGTGPEDGAGNPTSTAWTATADPVAFAKTGTRHFITGADNTIWQNTDDTPFALGTIPTAISGTIRPVYY